MGNLQDISQGFVGILLELSSRKVKPSLRSYWTWAILICLIVTNQLLGVSEKVWIKVGRLFVLCSALG